MDEGFDQPIAVMQAPAKARAHGGVNPIGRLAAKQSEERPGVRGNNRAAWAALSVGPQGIVNDPPFSDLACLYSTRACQSSHSLRAEAKPLGGVPN